jgi:uncharacterized membrane protein
MLTAILGIIAVISVVAAVVSSAIALFTRDEDDAIRFCVSALFCIIVFSSILLSFNAGHDSAQKEAIKAGAAHYELTMDDRGDPVNTFYWNVPAKPEKLDKK